MMRRGHKPILVIRVPHSMLAGYPNKAAGRYEQAIVEARKSIELDPDFAMGLLQSRRQSTFISIAWKRRRMSFGAQPDEASRSTNSSCWSMTSPS